MFHENKLLSIYFNKASAAKLKAALRDDFFAPDDWSGGSGSPGNECGNQTTFLCVIKQFLKSH
jgi:hypothetical protein